MMESMRLFRPSEHRILVVESDAETLRVVRAALQREGYNVAPAYDVSRALELVNEWAPSLVLSEVALMGGSGLELCRQIRRDRRFARTPVIFASSLANEADRIMGFESGADDYICKPFSVRELLLRIRARLMEVRPEPLPRRPDMWRFGKLEVHPESFRLLLDGRPVRLSGLEFRLLLALMSQPGQVLSRKSLAACLRSDDAGEITVRAIDSRVKRLRQKLAGVASYIQAVRGRGYRFDPGASDD